MINKFSHYLEGKKPILKTLVKQLSQEYSYVSILGTDVSGVSYQVDRMSVHVGPSSLNECGFVIKIYHNGIYSEYSTSLMDENNLDDIISAIKELVSFNTSNHKMNIPHYDEEEITKSFIRENKGQIFNHDEIIAKLKSYVTTICAKYPEIVNSSVGLENLQVSKIFISTKRELEQYYTWSGGRAFSLAKRDNNMKYGYDGFGEPSMEEVLTNLEPALEKTAKLAIELLDSVLPTPGFYDVITDPSITGLIAHEAFGHGVEMDQFVKDRALATEYVNKRVASDLVYMHDGAQATLSNASYFFDDAGVLAQDTLIIEKGILKRGISDLTSALELGTKPTGNSRRESYKRKAYARMTNTFFEAGTSKLADMIKSIEYGYYIGITNNGMEDPKNWGIQCTALYGKQIKNGQFTGKIISPVVMSGYVIDLLKSISMVSDGFEVIGSGFCGKGYKEWVPVSDGGPHLKAKVKIG